MNLSQVSIHIGGAVDLAPSQIPKPGQAAESIYNIRRVGEDLLVAAFGIGGDGSIVRNTSR